METVGFEPTTHSVFTPMKDAVGIEPTGAGATPPLRLPVLRGGLQFGLPPLLSLGSGPFHHVLPAARTAGMVFPESFRQPFLSTGRTLLRGCIKDVYNTRPFLDAVGIARPFPSPVQGSRPTQFTGTEAWSPGEDSNLTIPSAVVRHPTIGPSGQGYCASFGRLLRESRICTGKNAHKADLRY